MDTTLRREGSANEAEERESKQGTEAADETAEERAAWKKQWWAGRKGWCGRKRKGLLSGR
jgi:hypothetical protein